MHNIIIHAEQFLRVSLLCTMLLFMQNYSSGLVYCAQYYYSFRSETLEVRGFILNPWGITLQGHSTAVLSTFKSKPLGGGAHSAGSFYSVIS